MPAGHTEFAVIAVDRRFEQRWIAYLPAADAAARCYNDACWLMSQDHRVDTSRGAHSAFGKVVNIGTADADVLNLYLNFARSRWQLLAFAQPELPESGEFGNSHFLKS